MTEARVHVSSDRIMALWPQDLNQRSERTRPYECQTCRKPFSSTKSLRTHPCKGATRKGDKRPKVKPVRKRTLAQAIDVQQKRERAAIQRTLKHMEES